MVKLGDFLYPLKPHEEIQWSRNVKQQIRFWVDRLLELKAELRQGGMLLKDSIPTFFTVPQYDLYESQILYTIIRVLKPKKIVEAGCAQGWSTFWILTAADRNDNDAEVYSYDWDEHSIEMAKNNMAQLRPSPRAQWQTVFGNFLETSKKILPEPIDLFFVDLGHTLIEAQFYTENIFPKLAESHSMAIHDVEREEGEYMLSKWYPRNRKRYCLLGNRCQFVKDAVPQIESLLPVKHISGRAFWPSPSVWFFRNTINCPLKR